MMGSKYKIALCQMTVTENKEENLMQAGEYVREAARAGAHVACLPEIWNGPYDVKLFGSFAEPQGGPSTTLLSDLACEHEIHIVGGSIPEKDGVDVYNTSFVFSPTGEMIAKHRKAHLFDVDIEKGIRFKESDFFAAGNELTVFDTEYGRMGLAICFDLRFPEMFREMAKAGAHIVFLPANFNMTTGPAHWDLLIKSRALDNQIYMAACSSARNLDAPYVSWGHSCVATPWGEFCAAADARPSIIYADIDIDYLCKVRREIPLGN